MFTLESNEPPSSTTGSFSRRADKLNLLQTAPLVPPTFPYCTLPSSSNSILFTSIGPVLTNLSYLFATHRSNLCKPNNHGPLLNPFRTLSPLFASSGHSLITASSSHTIIFRRLMFLVYVNVFLLVPLAYFQAFQRCLFFICIRVFLAPPNTHDGSTFEAISRRVVPAPKSPFSKVPPRCVFFRRDVWDDFIFCTPSRRLVTHDVRCKNARSLYRFRVVGHLVPDVRGASTSRTVSTHVFLGKGSSIIAVDRPPVVVVVLSSWRTFPIDDDSVSFSRGGGGVAVKVKPFFL